MEPPYQLRTSRHRNLHRKLNLLGAGPQAFYMDVCRIRDTEPEFSTTTHLVGHLIREIESALRDLLRATSDLSKPKGDNAHIADIYQITEALGLPRDSPIVELWLDHAPRLAHAMAHRDNLQPPRPANEDFWRAVDEMESIFDFFLTEFEGHYSDIFDALDRKVELLDPTNDDAEWLKKNLPVNQACLSHFFDQLTNPNWIPLLAKNGIFARPAEPIQGFDGERGFISYPVWPPSRYLVRMANTASAEVAEQVGEILLTLTTDNFVVHLDKVDAARSLPIAFGLPVAKQEVEWLRTLKGIGHLIPDKFADLSAYLAQSGDPDTAVQILSILLRFRDPDEPEVDPSETFFRTEPRTLIERWDYGQVIGKCWESLAAADWVMALEFFCSILNEYLSLKYKDGAESGNSFSYIWHRAIDQDEDGVPERLVSAIRRVASFALSDQAALPKVLQILDGYKWDVYPRISLSLLQEFETEPFLESKRRLLQESNFRDSNLFHEYVQLLLKTFPHLDESDQAQIMLWVDDPGFTVATLKADRLENRGKDLTDEEAENYLRAAKLKWMEPLRDVLPDDWRGKYEKWTAAVGKPPHPGFLIGHVESNWVGERTSTVLRSFESVSDVFDYLSNESKGFRPPRDELSRELELLISEDIEKFLIEVDQFRAVDPIFVNGFISVLRTRTGAIPVDAWANLLAFLADMVMEGLLDSDLADEQGRRWLEVRHSVGELMSTLLSEESRSVPFAHRREVWKILKALAEDPNPTPEYEAKYGGNNMDPFTLSLNTIRGTAFHTLSKYLFWCKEEMAAPDGCGFYIAPEVKDVLEQHLDPTVDPSLTVRSVYGERLPSLTLIDADWVRTASDRIFPSGMTDRLGTSAWQTFIIYTQPWNNVFALVEPHYKAAISRIGQESMFGSSEQPDNKLAEHLIIFYARGVLEVGDGGLIDQFYSVCPDALAAHICWFIGHITRDGKVPGEVVERLRLLLETRFSAGPRGPKEMSAFGWVLCESFDPEWSLNRLHDALQVSPTSRADNFVIDELRRLSDSFPSKVLQCLTLMVDGAENEWKLQYWSPNIRVAITNAVKAGETTLANALVGKLATRGFDFRNLLRGA